MKLKQFLLIAAILSSYLTGRSQTKNVVPEAPGIQENFLWKPYNRTASFDNGVVHLDGRPGDGLLWTAHPTFENGTIELDIRGKNLPGQSFVGLAFHGLDSATYDAIYFRPFNFGDPEKSQNAIQYISVPEYHWHNLREKFPAKYEGSVTPVPDPEDWFHVRIVVNYPEVSVYVEQSKERTFGVRQLSSRKRGWIGFWVENNSEGSFRNLKITNQ